jgi:FHS family L-fucose permease-like MFS transporter
MQTAIPAPVGATPAFTERRYILTLIFVTSLFMLWGVGVTMGDILNKHFQEVLHVSKADSALVQFSIFGAYFIMGLPAGWFMKRFGYQKGVLLGLGLYALGAFLMVPAANALSFGYLRIALFVLACGLATLEAVAHPFLDGLGDPTAPTGASILPMPSMVLGRYRGRSLAATSCCAAPMRRATSRRLKFCIPLSGRWLGLSGWPFSS